MKNFIQKLSLLFSLVAFLFISNADAQTGYPYADYLMNSTYSLQHSWNAGQSGNAMVKEIERLGYEGQQRGNNNGNASNSGMNFINALNGVYNQKQKASNKRRSDYLKKTNRDNYNNAKYYRDYYLQYGDHGKAKYYQHMMDIYKDQ